ncbi:MAG: oligosaccharide flippase family protein, partial [Candidatus Cloacimonetes bacterium]|nr:oligosaccharide flippase family protein [Candidatus Cloacimonadota bacterium]
MPDRTRQAGIISLAEFFRFFIKTLIGILLARILNQEYYGSYRQLFLVYTSFSALLLLGVPQSLLFFLPKAQDETEQKQIIPRTLNLISLLAIVFSLSLLGFRVQLALFFNNPQLTNLLLIYAIYPLFLFISQLYSSVMLGLRKAESAAKFTIFAIVCDAVLIMGTALIFRKLEYIVTAVIIAAFLQWVYVHLHLRAYKLGWLFDATGLKQQLSYSLPLGLSSIIGILSIQLDKFVISGFFTPAQFAVFSVGAMELPFIGILTNSVNSVILPAISSQNDPAAGIDIYRASIRKNALIIFPLCLFSIIYAEQIITFLYGQSYLEASLYFRIYLLSLFLRIA